VYCPICGAEYREGFESCAECGTRLVESLPKEPRPHFNPLVTIATYRDLPEALVVRSVLDAAGIWAILANYYLIAIDWNYSTAVGGLQLQVRPADALDAASVLAVASSAEASEVELVQEWLVPEAACPNCGSTDFGSVNDLRETGAMFILLGMLWPLFFGHVERLAVAQWLFVFAAVVPIAIRRRRWRCNACDRTWKAEPSINLEDAPRLSSILSETTRRALLWLLWLSFALIALAMLRTFARQG
jgi:hypothetical protein